MIAIESETVRTHHYEPIATDFKVYLITDRKQCDGRPLMENIEFALKGGVKAIQLREKDLSIRNYLRLAYEVRALTLKHDARLFINDRVDIAVAIDADGVHLGQNSMPAFAVRKLAPRLIIGVSTHSLEEAIAAERNGADFITLGPIFNTPSKAKYGEPLGLDVLDKAVKSLNIPIFALGGIKLDNAAEVIERGPEGLSMISSILSAKNVKASAMKFLRMLR